jgi:hypothetical protein
MATSEEEVLALVIGLYNRERLFWIDLSNNFWRFSKLENHDVIGPTYDGGYYGNETFAWTSFSK